MIGTRLLSRPPQISFYEAPTYSLGQACEIVRQPSSGFDYPAFVWPRHYLYPVCLRIIGIYCSERIRDRDFANEWICCTKKVPDVFSHFLTAIHPRRPTVRMFDVVSDLDECA